MVLRYDSTYEIEGKDYPLEYVRWTLNRNMKSYISLIDNKKINISSLIDNIEPIQNAKVYSAFEKKRDQFLLFLNITLKMKKLLNQKFLLLKKNLEFSHQH